MSRIWFLTLFFIFQSFSVALAAGVRAQWKSSSRLIFKLTPGTYISNSTQFYLADGFQSIKSGTPIPLPLLSVKDDYAILDTSSISKKSLDDLIQRAPKVILTTASKQILDATPIQYAGVLDELYYYEGNDLGGNCTSEGCDLKVWAPTAQNVRAFVFASSNSPVDQAQVFSMTREEKGVWSLTLPKDFKNSFYLYEVQVYQPFTDKIETLLVTDPYSKSLNLNATRSQLLDLQDSSLAPSGWKNLKKPSLRSLKESIIYELHIRDFSAADISVPESYRGTYMAFAQKNSQGVSHLKSLADAGLTHLHLLPFNDFGSVNEDKLSWENYESRGVNLQEPQSVIGGIRTSDPFNWGYDPVHYMAPDGSYSRNPDGNQRIRETRSMVQSINEAGLRVVQDVAFNHTYRNGLDAASVFDKIVPLYYYRLDQEGNVLRTSCCFDTESEHRMMEKLMIDSVVHWAKFYKIDGFRFDLMSFHSRATMERIRQALRSLTLQRDGVDGSKILLYGEGWSFGSLYERAPADSMSFENSYGTGYGFFNDRLRNAARGGTTSSVEKSDQGFATGLFFDFNQEPANRNTPPDLASQRDKLLYLGDVIKAGLAGNLRDYAFKDRFGSQVLAGNISMSGAPVAVASQALETINYVSAHDGYSLWDAIQAKAPFHTHGRVPPLASSEDRQRMLQLTLAIPLLGQGIPFIEAGSELLRTKNGDQDSYDSGDFFNRIDWSGQNNYWGKGLPPAWKNIDDWSFWQPRLLDPQLQVTPILIAKTNEYFKALLRLRRSSSLFELNDLNEISEQLQFIDNDVQAEPGLIVMHLKNKKEELLVFFNSSRENRIFSHKLLKKDWKLHSLFDEKVDAALANVRLTPARAAVLLPGRSTVVLTPQKSALAGRGAR